MARLVQRLVPVRAEHGALPARPDPGVRVLDLAEDPAAAAHLRRRNDIATPDGAGRRGDDLRAGQAPLPQPGLAGHAGHRARALRRVRDPARAPDHGRRAVPVPAHAGGHAAAVGSRPPRAVAAPVRDHRRPARRGRDRALGRAAAARGVRRLHDHQADQLAEGGGHHRGLPGPGVRVRGAVLRRARAVRDDRQHRRVPVLPGDDVRRLHQDDGAGQRAVAVHHRAAGQAADRAGLHLDHRVAAGPLPAVEVLAGAEPAGGELRHPGHQGPAAGLRQGGVQGHPAGVRRGSG